MLHLLNNFIKFSIPGRNEAQFKVDRDFSCPYHYGDAANPYLFSLTSVRWSICYRTSQNVTHEAGLAKNKVVSSHHRHLSQRLWNAGTRQILTNNSYNKWKTISNQQTRLHRNSKIHNVLCSFRDTGFRRLEKRWSSFHHTKQIREYFSCQTENAEVEISLLWYEHPEFWHYRHFQRLICFGKVGYNVV